MKSLKCNLCKKPINDSGDLSIGQYISTDRVEFALYKKLRPYHVDCFTKTQKKFKYNRSMWKWNMFHVVSFGVLDEEKKFNLYSFIFFLFFAIAVPVILKPNLLGFVILSPLLILLYVMLCHHPLLSLYNIYKIEKFLKTDNIFIKKMS